MIVVVMGVSGSGKSTIGKLLADRMNCRFADADDFHSADNKAKMKSGLSLNDEDRLPWLKTLAKLIETNHESGTSLVLACSALKASYRTVLGEGEADIVFVHLKASYETIAGRLKNRRHEFMNPDLLKSQFETLEMPEDAIEVDGSRSPEEIVEQLLGTLSAR